MVQMNSRFPKLLREVPHVSLRVGLAKTSVRLRPKEKLSSDSDRHQTFFYVALPGFVVSDAPLCLLARQCQSPGYVTNAFGPIILLVVWIAGCLQVKIVSPFPLCLNVLGCLYSAQFWHV